MQPKVEYTTDELVRDRLREQNPKARYHYLNNRFTEMRRLEAHGRRIGMLLRGSLRRLLAQWPKIQ